MATITLKAGMVWKGAYDASVTYDKLDVVYNADKTQIAVCKQGGSGIPLTNSNYWEVSIDASGIIALLEDALAHGEIYTMKIGSVTTGATSSATIVNNHQTHETILNLVLEKGEKGDKGDKGDRGEKGDTTVIDPSTGKVYTLYNQTGNHTDGAMTQEAVTKEFEKLVNGKTIDSEIYIFNPLATTDGYYLQAPPSAGSPLITIESAVSCYSDYIPVVTGQTYHYVGDANNRIFLLNENKNYVGAYILTQQDFTFEISNANAKYIQINIPLSYKDSTEVSYVREAEMINYNQVDGIVDKNKLVLSNGNFTTIDYNIFNKETITENAYLKLVAIGSPLQVVESEGLAYSAPIPISINVLYTYKGASGNIRIFALDKNLNVVQYLTTSGGDFSFSNNSIKYIQFWFSLSKLNDTLITQKEQRGNIEYKQIDNIPDSIIKTIVLNANPTNFRSILESAVGGNYNNRYRIQVPNGTYDIYSMFTTEEIEDNDFRGLWVGPFVEIVGVGSPDKTIFTCYREVFSSQCSPFNLDVTASISNVTILSDNCRYAVHDDWTLENWTGESMEADERYWFTAFTKGFVRVCKNLIVQSSNSAYGPAFGCGIHNGANWIYDHCVFKGSVDGGFAYACHNSQDTAISANVTLVNCRADGYKFRFGSLNTGAGSLCYAHLIGNKAIGVDLIEENPVTLGTGIKWSVDGYANTFSNEDIAIYNTDSEDYSDRKDLI